MNQGRFLQTCIDSVAQQDWENLEHIIVDGGSTDNSLEIIEKNRNSLSQVIVEADSGAADAINKGLAQATGDIVAWLNSDDFYLPNAFAKVAEAWEAEGSASFWFGNGVRADESGTVKSIFNPGLVVYDHRALVEGLDYILQPSTFVNAKVLKAVGYLNTSLRWGFDWDLWVRLAEYSAPRVINGILAASREWGGTLTSGGGFRRVEELRLLAEQHGKRAITHGSLRYLLDVVEQELARYPAVFDPSLASAVHDIHVNVVNDMDRRLGVDALGMPKGPEAMPAEPEEPVLLREEPGAVALSPIVARTPPERPRISIVTPSLNQGRFLQACIDSVAEQNWPDVEHIVIDGGSTDESIEVLARNKSALTLVLIEKDGGAAEAINKGLRLASGNIVAWLNADDFYLPGTFEKLARAWADNPGASFWFGNGIRVDEDGNKKSVFNPGRVNFDQRALVEGLDYILQPATFMNAATLREADLLNTGLRWGFDWDLWIRLAKLSPPYPIDDVLAASREWGGTLTSGGGLRRAAELRQLVEDQGGPPLTHGSMRYLVEAISREVAENPGIFNPSMSETLHLLRRQIDFDMRGTLRVDSLGLPRAMDESTEPLTIAVDLYPLFPGVSGGIVPWVKGVLREMARLYPMDRLIMFHRPGKPPIEIAGDNVHYIALHDDPKLFYADMTKRCATLSIDAVLRTYPQERHPRIPLSKHIFVIPDIQHEYLPEFHSKEAMTARRRAFGTALAAGGAAATLTEHSQKTLLDYPWTSAETDVFLMPAALPEELRIDPAPGDLPEKAKAFDRYFYMPANLWKHKNHRRLFEAFGKALGRLPANTGLVLTGSPDGWGETIAGFENLPIVHLGFLEHRQVAALFKNAEALVYFSLFEGFGMPLLEAFYHGTPVLCSNTTSLPEVGGDAMLACDPLDTDAMAGLMIQIVEDPDLRERLSVRAHERVNAYSWEMGAKALRAKAMALSQAAPVVSQDQPLVSIVMPTRNHAQFIRAAIDSVLQQDYPNIELLVRDGLSTDGTLDILRSYGERISWVSEKDAGQTDAINKGMLTAKGEILAYLNSDDILLPGAVSAVVAYLNAKRECDIVYGDAQYIDANGAVIGRYATARFSMARLMRDNCICQPATFWRRRIYERVGPFNDKLQTAMDYEYWLRAYNAGAVIYFRRGLLAQSRLHSDAKTIKMREKIFEEVFDICRTQGGYVSFSYMQGLWSYRLYESWFGGRLLRLAFPSLFNFFAMREFSKQIGTQHGRAAGRQYFRRSVFNAINRRFPPVATALRSAWRRMPRLRQLFI